MNSTEPQKAKVPLAPFSKRLLEWYSIHAREMPWRTPPHEHDQGARTDPYHVWLSEVMLQQTQVATVKQYFLKFVNTWPTVFDLAQSDLEDVLKAWAGLGYYSRARNLKKCADVIVADHSGQFPQRYDELKKLPGIGDYTASAIASIAFDQPVAVVDGNVERVISRHRKIETRFPEAKAETKSLVTGMLDHAKPGEFAQATMDLGATICSPKRPACSLCPVNADCKGFENGNAELFPFKQQKAEKPTRRGAAYVMFNSDGDVFLCKRQNTGLLAGMTQVPTNAWNSRQDGSTGAEEAPSSAQWKKCGIAKHTFTHFHLELTVWSARDVEKVNLKGWWCPVDAVYGEAMPKIMLKVVETAL